MNELTRMGLRPAVAGPTPRALGAARAPGLPSEAAGTQDVVTWSQADIREPAPSAPKVLSAPTPPSAQQATPLTRASSVPTVIAMGDDAPGEARDAWPAPLDPKGLTTGAPHPESREIARILGVPMTVEGLNRCMQAICPGAKAVSFMSVTPAGRHLANVPPNDQVFMSSALPDGDGMKIGHYLRTCSRVGDALEWKSGIAWIDPSFRGEGATVHGVLQEIAMLRTLSPHPDTCLKLGAGAAAGRDYSVREQMGCYLWARMGIFEFDGSDQLENMRAGFLKYAEKHGIDPAQAKSIAAGWTHPYDIATTRIEGVRLPAQLGEERPRMAQVGKAYLMSGDAPSWRGKCYVNREPGQQARAGLRALRIEQGIADRTRSQKEAAWMKALIGRDDAAQRAAIAAIGRRGGNEWQVPLSRLRDDPSVGTLAAEAMRKVSGESLLENLERQIVDEGRSVPERIDALGSFIWGKGTVSPAMAEGVAHGKDDRMRRAVLEYVPDRSPAGYLLADAILARDKVDPAQPFDGRAGRSDAIRFFMRAGDAGRLEGLHESDPELARAVCECLAVVRGGEAKGFAALPLGTYPQGMHRPATQVADG